MTCEYPLLVFPQAHSAHVVAMDIDSTSTLLASGLSGTEHHTVSVPQYGVGSVTPVHHGSVGNVTQKYHGSVDYVTPVHYCSEGNVTPVHHSSVGDVTPVHHGSVGNVTPVYHGSVGDVTPVLHSSIGVTYTHILWWFGSHRCLPPPSGASDGSIKVWDCYKQYCTHNFKGSGGVVR